MAIKISTWNKCDNYRSAVIAMASQRDRAVKLLDEDGLATLLTQKQCSHLSKTSFAGKTLGILTTAINVLTIKHFVTVEFLELPKERLTDEEICSSGDEASDSG